MRVRVERIPEKDHEVDATLGDAGAHLLIAAQRATEESGDVEIELGAQNFAGRARGKELVTGECPSVVARPLEQVVLAIVVGDEGDALHVVHANRSSSSGAAVGAGQSAGNHGDLEIEIGRASCRERV